jgi:hypothetical protein
VLFNMPLHDGVINPLLSTPPVAEGGSSHEQAIYLWVKEWTVALNRNRLCPWKLLQQCGRQGIRGGQQAVLSCAPPILRCRLTKRRREGRPREFFVLAVTCDAKRQ